MAEYGIGRVPADVDPVAERMAEIEAARLTASKSVELVKCPHCKQMYNKRLGMTSARGTVCPDCYDECEEV